ncbi:hypothetical protein AZ34_14540 [Hylemonella gracilis str. Niagara R]|uniref:histidine kinase n=1 Tax=Hylemonella gracilis str. Niagara R TaxID=1458275 RepID=A0A016XMZ1_9BURK|nr:sensor histidine kinase [Hylemonella gracilis]EYC52947.1 hypothetical protein AZ34_14540 [Hylemonella gracilis str. Niagara R]
MPEDTTSLKVSAHVLVQLGSELVTDVDQALLECVKNAYDADSPGCRIEIDTRDAGEIHETATAEKLLGFSEASEGVQVVLYDDQGKRIDGPNGSVRKLDPQATIHRHLHYMGKVSIEDSGDGISPEKIASSWLVISGSAKRSDGQGPKKATNKGRTPLGDKGLGRLGTMKLGDILEVESATSADMPLTVAHFRWQDCQSAVTVDKVPVFTQTRENTKRFKGTRINIYGLKDLPDWRRTKRIEELARTLARLVSPFESTSTFPVAITLDGIDSSLGSVTEQVLSQAIAKFDFRWDMDDDGNEQLVARAKFMTRLFTAARNATQREKANLAFNRDGGLGFRKFLDTFGQTKPYKKSAPESDGCFIEFERRFPWTDMMLDSGVAIENPGPFRGAFYFFHLDSRDAPGDEAATGLAVSRGLIKDLSGISILRDGFRVRSQGDWLNLSTGMTSGSIYNMRVNNTIGYFALTGAKNFRLVEKSDREGFVENAAYRGFNSIAIQCREFANDSLESVRRALDKYYKDLKAQEAQFPSTDPIQIVERSVAASESAQTAAKEASDALSVELLALQNRLKTGKGSTDLVVQALNIAKKATAAMTAVQTGLPARASIKAALEKVKLEREETQEQFLSLYESAAVGLSARGLAHELRTHIGEIRQRMNSITRAAKSGSVDERTLVGHIKAMRDACSAILSSASLIDPMLPRSRMLKDTFLVSDFIAEYVENRQHELLREDVIVKVSNREVGLEVRMNRARLLQVIDNLVRNSLYWLQRGYLTKTVSRPKEISIEIGNGTLSIADSGPGVDPHYEDSLFDIFISGKPADGSDGQGLGLFIVKQLLAADGCDIQLSNERNPEGNRYRFTIDLGAVRT